MEDSLDNIVMSLVQLSPSLFYIIITYILYTNNQIDGTVEIITIADDAVVGETGVPREKPTMEAKKNWVLLTGAHKLDHFINLIWWEAWKSCSFLSNI